jgi:hypothetical protein
VADIEVPEGNGGDAGQAVFTVTLGAAAAQPVTVGYSTVNGTAAGGRDYTPTSGTLTYTPGETTRTVTVAVAGDDLDESDEDFLLNIGRVTGATVAGGAARAVVTDDDQPQLDITDAGLAEGDTGTATLVFTVTLTPPSTSPVTVTFATADQTATAGQDYEAATGGLTFNPGDRTKTVAIRVAADTADRADETFTVSLSATVTAGPSSSTMVAVATVRAGSIGVPPPAFDRTRVRASSASSALSAAIGTATVLTVSPGLKVRVPFAPV